MSSHSDGSAFGSMQEASPASNKTDMAFTMLLALSVTTKRTFSCRLLSAMTASMASAIFWPVCDPWKAWNASKRETGSPHRKAWTVTQRNACGDLLPALALPFEAITCQGKGLKCQGQGQGQGHDCQGQGRSFPALRPGQGQGLTSL